MAAAHGATGDIKNNLMKLLREVQRMKLRVEADIQGLCLGAPSSLLPILHHSLMHYSLPLASWLSKHDYGLYGKNDLRFVEGVYKVLREEFHYHPRLTKEQFLTVGYAERKLQLVTDLLMACQDKHRTLAGCQHTRRGRTERERRRTRGSGNTQASKSEVLTVQSTSGISSAWTEPIATRVQGPHRGDFVSLLSPEHSPPPHSLTIGGGVTLTPSPTPNHTLPSHSSPITLHTHSHKSQPIVVRHNTPIIQGISEQVPSRVNVQPGGPPDMTVSRQLSSSSAPRENLVIENVSSMSSSSEAGSGERASKGRVKEGKLEPPEGPPTVDGLLHQGVQEESRSPRPQTQTGNLPTSEQVTVVEVSERVQQLARMVERMSARFVLLETKLKTVGGAARSELGHEEQTHQQEHSVRDSGVCTHGERNEPPQLEKRHMELSSSPEEEKSCVVKGCAPLVTAAPIVFMAIDTSTVSTPTAGTALVSKATPMHSDAPRDADFVKSDVTTWSTPHSLTSTHPHCHPLTGASKKPTGSSGTTLSSQLARIRAEQQMPPLTSSHLPTHTPSLPHSHTPLHTPSRSHTPLHPPSRPHSHTPSHPNVPTPKGPNLHLSPSPHISSSPSDTTRMLASLRDRAQRTREFLQKANNRL